MTAKDWIWYASALEGSITTCYLQNLPEERQSSFYERVVAHQTELLFSEDRLDLTDSMKQLLDLERTILNHYEKSSETKVMLREFKYKVLLAKYSFGILKSKHDGAILDESFRLFPELREKNSPRRSKVKPAPFSPDGGIRNCLMAVKLLVFRDQTRKAAYVLNELVGGDLSLDFFRANPLSAVIYLIHALPVYGIRIEDAFVHRAMQHVKYFWKDLQLHVVELILYYLELLQQVEDFSRCASDAILWFKCFKLNTFYHILSSSEVEGLFKTIVDSNRKEELQSSAIVLSVLRFPAINFTNVPYLRSVNVSCVNETQLHLHPSALETLVEGKLFEFQSVQLEKNSQRRYSWPASSSFVVQLVFANALKTSDNMTLQVELLTSGVEVEVEKRLVRIPPLSVESVNFEVGLKYPGEVSLDGYRIFWEETNHDSIVIFGANSKFVHKYVFDIPYLECFWYPNSSSNQIQDKETNDDTVKEFITKDFVLKQEVFYGTRKEVVVYLGALTDLKSFDLSTISKYPTMFSASYEKKMVSKGDKLPVKFHFDTTCVNFDKTGVTNSIEYQSFVKLAIENVTIPFFTIQLKVVPSVYVEAVEFLAANDLRYFNVCFLFKNLVPFSVTVTVADSTIELKPASSKRTILRRLKKSKSEKPNLLDLSREGSGSLLQQFFDNLQMLWTREASDISGKVYLPSGLFTDSSESRCKLWLDDTIPIRLEVVSGGQKDGPLIIEAFSGHRVEVKIDIDCSEFPEDFNFRTCSIISEGSSELPWDEETSNFALGLPVVLGPTVSTVSPGAPLFVEILPVFAGSFAFHLQFGAVFKSQSFRMNVYLSESEGPLMLSDSECSE